mmetsp:Transcript_29448/g.48814  ORF Transcript_29448/g.48814 Transcript_29448/m.48814 type:complete len:313 (+) Transcript_29448:3-941(+)
MGKLIIEEEDDADKEFYQQQFWEEEGEEDGEYVADADDEAAGDSFDSDFGDSTESDSDEDEKNEKAVSKEKSAARKRSVYKDPKSKEKKGNTAEHGASGSAARPKIQKKRARPEGDDAMEEQTIQRGSLRASTQEAAALATEKRRVATQMAEQRAQRMAGRPGVQLRRLTQEEILAEAKQTEIINRASLEMLLRNEEEKKRTAVREKTTGPHIKTRSVRIDNSVHNTVTFVECPLPAAIDGVAPEYPAPARCTVTNLPAKYFDPLTGCPYATLEAFRMLRGKTGRRNTHSVTGAGLSANDSLGLGAGQHQPT